MNPIRNTSAGLIAGKTGSHRVLGQPQFLCSTRSLWELACQRLGHRPHHNNQHLNRFINPATST